MPVNTGAIHGEPLLWQKVQGTSGGFKILVAEATGTATEAATFAIATAVPAGAILLGCQLRVDMALSNNFDAAYKLLNQGEKPLANPTFRNKLDLFFIDH